MAIWIPTVMPKRLPPFQNTLILGGHGSLRAFPTPTQQGAEDGSCRTPQHPRGPDLTHPSKRVLVVVFFPSMKTSRGELTLDFHDLALAVILGIAGLVAPAFVYRLRAPVSHSLLEHENLETAWTLGPIFVLVGLAVPRLQLLYTIDDRAGGVRVCICEGHQ